jgi:translation initiation factor 1
MNIVFSTNPDFQFDEKPEVETLAPERQKLRVNIERHHRGGKTATVVSGFVGTDEDLQSLARTLKTKCGTGGSAKDGLIIIQGEVKDKIIPLLLQMGYKNTK